MKIRHPTPERKAWPGNPSTDFEWRVRCGGVALAILDHLRKAVELPPEVGIGAIALDFIAKPPGEERGMVAVENDLNPKKNLN